MCGIVGILRNESNDILQGTVRKMTADVSHRGPDDEGIVFLSVSSRGDLQHCSETDDTWKVALGCRRLSILDLSFSGHMPMAYHDRFWIVYNGEIYNFIEIRLELERLGHIFRSSSDTEVILAAYEQWGSASFALFRGMWGFIIFDCLKKEAILCRDRLGIKPLYLWQRQGMLAVASEIKQFLSLPGFTAHIDLITTTEYFQTGYENPNRSFLRDIQIVPAGSWLKIPLDTLIPSVPEEYWHPERVQISITDVEEAGALFANELRESVRLHLRSDVPVGCALSGGLDSSAIAVLINELQGGQNHQLQTFTSTFPGDKVDERKYADALATRIGAAPHYVTPNPITFLEEMDSFLRTHDEPVGSISMYAGYCIARLTRQAGVPVTLNGQGGDEILSGYWQSYFLYLRELGMRGNIKSLIDHFAGAMMKDGNPDLLTQAPLMLRRYRSRSNPAALVRIRKAYDAYNGHNTVLQKILALDGAAWRIEQIRNMFLPRFLKWDDRNSMAFSVEGRYPFLDHELIELCLSFAPQILFHHGWTKWPLRIGLRNILPDEILYRRTKIAFEVPQDEWLCGPLRPTLENWLKQDRPLWNYVEQVDAQHLAVQTWHSRGKRSELGQALFRLFIFDRWLELYEVNI